jgi:hypothetical protein
MNVLSLLLNSNISTYIFVIERSPITPRAYHQNNGETLDLIKNNKTGSEYVP